MNLNEEEKNPISYTVDRSYAALRVQFQNILKSERAIWKGLYGLWYIPYVLHLPLIVLLFLPIAFLNALLWPLGPLRTAVSVGVVFAMTAPVFEMWGSSLFCVDTEIELGVRILDYDDYPVEGARVILEGKDVLVTDTTGRVFFKNHVTTNRLSSRSVARQYCPECFETRKYAIQVLLEQAQLDTVITRTINFGNELYGTIHKLPTDPDRNAIILHDIIIPKK